MSRQWKLYLGELAAKILHKCLVKAPAGLYWPFADQFEALIDGGKGLFCDECRCLLGRLDLWILGSIAEFLQDLCGSLAALAQIAKHPLKKFLRIVNCHYVLLFGSSHRLIGFEWFEIWITEVVPGLWSRHNPAGTVRSA